MTRYVLHARHLVQALLLLPARRDRDDPPEGLLLGAASVAVGYVIVATVRTDTLALLDYGSLSSFTDEQDL